MKSSYLLHRIVPFLLAALTTTGCSVADVDWVISGVIAEVDWLLGVEPAAAADSTGATSTAAEFAMFVPATHDATRGWKVVEQSGKRCFQAFHNKNPDLLTTVTVRQLMARYGAVAEQQGFQLATEEGDGGQPSRVYERGNDVLQMKIGHGRGNYTVKINFGRWHCRG